MRRRPANSRQTRRTGVTVIFAVTAAVLASGCGVQTGEAAARVPGVRLAVPDGWRQVTLCTGQGTATAALPSRVELDGPRDLRNIDQPAQGTFAWGYNPDRSIRYDLYAIQDADAYGPTDRAIARKVVLQLNGDPQDVTIRNLEERGDHVIGTYDEWFSDRDFRTRIVAHEGSVVAIGVGVYEYSSAATIAQAKRDLEVMWQSLEVAGVDGVPTGLCTGPSDEPR